MVSTTLPIDKSQPSSSWAARVYKPALLCQQIKSFGSFEIWWPNRACSQTPTSLPVPLSNFCAPPKQKQLKNCFNCSYSGNPSRALIPLPKAKPLSMQHRQRLCICAALLLHAVQSQLFKPHSSLRLLAPTGSWSKYLLVSRSYSMTPCHDLLPDHYNSTVTAISSSDLSIYHFDFSMLQQLVKIKLQ